MTNVESKHEMEIHDPVAIGGSTCIHIMHERSPTNVTSQHPRVWIPEIAKITAITAETLVARNGTPRAVCVDRKGARAMASSRGILNIQSLNELTSENAQPASARLQLYVVFMVMRHGAHAG